MKQRNSNCGTLWGHSGTVRWNSVMEQWNSDGGTVEKWNSHGGTVRWKSGTVMVWWNSGTLIVEQCDETVEQ